MSRAYSGFNKELHIQGVSLGKLENKALILAPAVTTEVITKSQ